MTTGIVPRFANEAVLGIAVVAGLLVALARPLPQMLGAVLAIVLGLAIALDSPPEVLSVSEANLMLIGTGIGAAAFLIVVALATRQAQARWAKIGHQNSRIVDRGDRDPRRGVAVCALAPAKTGATCFRIASMTWAL